MEAVGFQTVGGSVRRAGGGELDDERSALFKITFWLERRLGKISDTLLNGGGGSRGGAAADSWDSS